jgi:hypothetical protein
MASPFAFDTTINLDDLTISIAGYFERGYRAVMYGDYPDPGQPDAFDITTIQVKGTDGNWHELPSWLLTDEQRADLIEEAVAEYRLHGREAAE